MLDAIVFGCGVAQFRVLRVSKPYSSEEFEFKGCCGGIPDAGACAGVFEVRVRGYDWRV